jgi:hypothetical protein
MLTAEGMQGSSCSFDGRTVTISRTGLARFRFGSGDKSIPVGQVTAVQLHPTSRLSFGFIQFTIGGGVEPHARDFLRQVQAAERDENSVIFRRKHEKEFVALAEAVREACGADGTVPNSATDDLGKLAELRDRGVLTDEEFAAKKAELLARL